MLFPITIHLTLILAAASLASAYPTWWMAVFQFRCKAPNIVESYTQDWDEWRVSSVCRPGTCCASYAESGPLCLPEACDKAVQERERLLETYKNREKAKKKKEDAKKDTEEEKAKKEKEAIAKWKPADAKAEAEREKALAEVQAEV